MVQFNYLIKNEKLIPSKNKIGGEVAVLVLLYKAAFRE